MICVVFQALFTPREDFASLGCSYVQFRTQNEFQVGCGFNLSLYPVSVFKFSALGFIPGSTGEALRWKTGPESIDVGILV